MPKGIRAGIIGEIGMTWPHHPDEVKVLRAAVRAQQSTGVPLSIHSGRDPRAPLAAMDEIERASGDPSRTVMGHIDRTLTRFDDIRALAERGRYVEFDLFGQESTYYALDERIDMPTDAVRIDHVMRLIEMGFGEQVVVSQDVCRKAHPRRYGGEGYGHLLSRAVPLMHRKGMRQAERRDPGGESMRLLTTLGGRSMSGDMVVTADRLYVAATDLPRTWMVVREGKVVAVGDGEPPAADATMSFDGKTVFPGFVDGHVHLSWTGLANGGIDLSAATSRDELLVLAGRVLDGEVIGLGFDETRWDDPRPPSLEELDRLAPSMPLVLPRIDTYLCLANTTAMRAASIEGRRGIERDAEGLPTGLLRTEAAADVHRNYLESVPERAIVDAFRRATDDAVSHGLTSVHEMSMPDKRGRRDAEIVLRVASELAPDLVVYIADLDVDRVQELDLAQIGGDLFLDGSIGARTAATAEPYLNGGGRGVLTYEDAELQEFLHEANRRGLQIALHVIGQRAIDQALRGLAAVHRSLDQAGSAAFRARRHRLEHFEMATPVQMRETARLGLVASVQPAFDALWGHQGQLYAQRLGEGPAEAMNAFRSMERAGVWIGGGSDTPMSTFDPMSGVWALEHPHDPAERWGRAEALEVFSRRAARLAPGEVRKGELSPGFDADFVVLRADPLEVEDVRGLVPEHTFVRGRLVYSA